MNTWILPFLVGGLRYTAKRIPRDDRATELPTAIFAVTAVVAVRRRRHGIAAHAGARRAVPSTTSTRR